MLDLTLPLEFFPLLAFIMLMWYKSIKDTSVVLSNQMFCNIVLFEAGRLHGDEETRQQSQSVHILSKLHSH